MTKEQQEGYRIYKPEMIRETDKTKEDFQKSEMISFTCDFGMDESIAIETLCTFQKGVLIILDQKQM